MEARGSASLLSSLWLDKETLAVQSNKLILMKYSISTEQNSGVSCLAQTDFAHTMTFLVFDKHTYHA